MVKVIFLFSVLIIVFFILMLLVEFVRFVDVFKESELYKILKNKDTYCSFCVYGRELDGKYVCLKQSIKENTPVEIVFIFNKISTDNKCKYFKLSYIKVFKFILKYLKLLAREEV